MRPTSVRVGANALGKAWRTRTVRSSRPLARAWVMKSSDRTSIAVARIILSRLPHSAIAVADLFRVLLKAVAARHDVAAKLIATTDELDRIALDDNADVPALHGWRRELFGETALRLKRGEIALAVKANHVVALKRL